MTLRQLAWFVLAYAATVATAIWFDLAVLCRGAAKYANGCGGFAVYIPLWEMFLVPLLLAAILLERWKRSGPPPTSRLLGYLVVILAVAEIGFLLIVRFPVLLALEAGMILLAILLRTKTATPRRL